MSRVSQKLYRNRLNKALSLADDEELFLMVWAIIAVQSGRAEKAIGILNFPEEAIIQDHSSRYFVHQWRLETLVNEALCVPKKNLVRHSIARNLDCSQYDTLATLFNTLGKLENAEDGLVLQRVSVLREMHRLAQRQFEWQRGMLSHSQLYRSAYIYGGEITRNYFEGKYEFSMNDFCKVCFALRAMWFQRPVIELGVNLAEIGISEHTSREILRTISMPHGDVRAATDSLRSGFGHTGYKRSVLRQFPCVAFGHRNERILCPLPDLVTLRSTTGLFYDVIDGGGEVRNEVGRRFEEYCLDLSREMAPLSAVSSSFRYRYRGNTIDSPDLLVEQENEIKLIVECKATRMSYEARFSEAPLVDAGRGYDELAKGVFQIWRFVSHHRRGYFVDRSLRPDVRGMVLTLDTWLSMSAEMQTDVIDRATRLASSRDREILDEDRIGIIFCPIEQLERTYNLCTEASFFQTLDAACEDDYKGWQLDGVHEHIAPEIRSNNDFPFEGRIGDIQPWWREITDAGLSRELIV